MKNRQEYIKHHSFKEFHSNVDTKQETQRERVIRILHGAKQSQHEKIFQSILSDLENYSNSEIDFKITLHIADELSKIEDIDVSRYLYHRYRYDIYPKKKILDQFPPYLQIEPTSICNYRCVFCYQTDAEFTNKKNGFMGFMSFELFKIIIDQIEDKIDFLSLASRGEPLLCRDIDQMLEYCQGKFLGLKLNTNASMLNEKHSHAILSGGVNTVVFSADAANENLYSQLRVNGSLKKILANIQMFQKIKETHYPNSKIITRVSGVRYSDSQDMDSMINLWSSLVDQISFVAYNPWENIYASEPNEIKKACSDLWRRMFIWFDGTVNPCDTDYKSSLKIGNIKENRIEDLWSSIDYQFLREQHIKSKRSCVNPCNRCTVI